MFPIRWNKAYRNKDGSLVKIDDAMSGGGGGGYTLPTATANRLGGVKIGNGVTVQDDGTISVSGGGSSFVPDYQNERLIIGVHDNFNYFIPMEKEYVGPGSDGYEIETNPGSTADSAKIDLYSIIYENGAVTIKEFVKTLVHNRDNTYEDDNISIAYNSGGASWVVTSKVPLYNEIGTLYTSPLTWTYSETVDYIMLLKDLS